MSNSTPRPPQSSIHRDAWLLDPAITYLNHGAFGACPRVILDRQHELRLEMEREPIAFLIRWLTPRLDESRDTLAGLIGADPADLVFVQNATAGVNAVLRSLEFSPGDEILVTTHDYNACRNVAHYVARRTGTTLVIANVPLPITGPQQVIDAVLERVTARTRLAMLDHITSPTALIFPVEELVRKLGERGIDTLVDGAHAPGMIPLDMKRIGAAYYTGNCHKWLCAPRGAGFLHVRRDRQRGIEPPIISHGWNRPRPDHSPIQDVFDWPGTFDPTAWLCVGEAIRFLGGLMPGGLPALMRRNHELAVSAQDMLCRRLGLAPVGIESMLGSIAAVQLPDAPPDPAAAAELPYAQVADASCPIDCTTVPGGADGVLHDRLFFDFGIEVPVFYWPAPPQLVLRVSAQAYNDPTQYERLADALAKSECCGK